MFPQRGPPFKKLLGKFLLGFFFDLFGLELYWAYFGRPIEAWPKEARPIKWARIVLASTLLYLAAPETLPVAVNQDSSGRLIVPYNSVSLSEQ